MTAGTPPRSRRDLRGSLTRLAAALLGLGRTRLALAAVEFEDARAKAAAELILVLVAGLAFALAVLAASMLVVVLFWDTHRIAVLVGMTLVYVLVGAASLWRLSVHRKAQAPAFSATLAELERDAAWLARQFGGRE